MMSDDQRNISALPLDGLPPELVRLLREVPIGALTGDRDLERALYVLDKVPSNTASAMQVDDWKKAWVETWQRANRAEVTLAEIAEKCRWYADNPQRDPHEVDHALCVEILAMAEEAS